MDNKVAKWSEAGAEFGSIFFMNFHIIVTVGKNVFVGLLRNVFFF
jgi:hypothetical protein